MDKMPKMSSARKNKPTHECACGCGLPTRATWHPGHDGRATGWAIRIERGLMGLAEIPENERAGAILRLEQRGTLEAAEIRQAAERAA